MRLSTFYSNLCLSCAVMCMAANLGSPALILWVLYRRFLQIRWKLFLHCTPAKLSLPGLLLFQVEIRKLGSRSQSSKYVHGRINSELAQCESSSCRAVNVISYSSLAHLQRLKRFYQALRAIEHTWIESFAQKVSCI